MTDPIEKVRHLNGVQYVTEFGGNYRVVFEHDADSTTVHEVERYTGCAGRMGSTQEHLPCIEYPIDEVDQ